MFCQPVQAGASLFYDVHNRALTVYNSYAQRAQGAWACEAAMTGERGVQKMISHYERVDEKQ